ncbi:aldo/keto reductase [bacterium]|nr:aldo/keto reductase [bacterium]
MITRQLGNSDLHLTEVGFGAWAVGGDWKFGWGHTPADEAVAAIRRGLELGINWIDTAAIYGLGRSEELVAKAIEGHRDEVIVATKCSLVWDDKGEVGDNLTRGSVRRECENSLRRLNTDFIDLYQIHWPNDDPHIEEGWEEIGRLIEEGKVRYGGVSNFLTSHLDRAESIHHVSSLQPPYSMLRRFIEDEELQWCAEKGTGVIAYSPMQSGLLTGTFSMEKVQDTDFRQKAGEYQEPNLSINLDFVEKLRPIAQKYDKTVAQLAIAWVLRRPEVTSAIVGARKPSQIEETVGGAGWTIEQEDLDTIETLLQDRENRLREQNGFLIQINR